MRVVIDISEKSYKKIECMDWKNTSGRDEILCAIHNGIVLPKGHGRLISSSSLKRKMQKAATEAWKMKIKAPVETVWNQAIDLIDEALTVLEADTESEVNNDKQSFN